MENVLHSTSAPAVIDPTDFDLDNDESNLAKLEELKTADGKPSVSSNLTLPAISQTALSAAW